MKKVLLSIIVFSSILISVCSYAVINTPNVIALNTSTYTAVTVPLTNGVCRPMAAYVDDGTSFLIAVDSSGTGEATVPANTFWSDSCVTDTAGVIFYAKASAGTPNIVVLVGAVK